MNDAESFEAVAGQRVSVDRPPAGYVAIADTHGTSCVVSLEVLSDPELVKHVLDQLAASSLPSP